MHTCCILVNATTCFFAPALFADPHCVCVALPPVCQMPSPGATALHRPATAARRAQREVVNMDAGVVYQERPVITRASYSEGDLEL